MYLVQGLMGNLPNRDHHTVSRLAEFLDIPNEECGHGSPLAPKCLRPETHNFAFGSGTGDDG